MISRLHKTINYQRRAALTIATKERDEQCSTQKTSSDIDMPFRHNLPFPRKLFIPFPKRQKGLPISQSSHLRVIIKSSTEPKDPHNEWVMMRKHNLWIRLFHKYDELLFNHAAFYPMHTSQMIHLCTKLVKHLNLISQTAELEAQKALGTLEETIIAQLTPPLNVKSQYPSWNLQETDKSYYDVEAIAVIRQNEDGIFKGQLTDAFINTTFQLQ